MWLPVFGNWEGEGAVALYSVHTFPWPSFQCDPLPGALCCAWVLSQELLWLGFSREWTPVSCQIGGGLVVWCFYRLSSNSPIFSPLPHLCLLWYLVPPVLESSQFLWCKCIDFLLCMPLGFSFLCPAKSAFYLIKMGWHLWSALVSSSILCVFLGLHIFCFFTVISLDFLKGCRDKCVSSILHV